LILWKARQEGSRPSAYATTFLRQMEEVLGTWPGSAAIRVAANAGGLQPRGPGRERMTELSGRLGLKTPRPPTLTGDDPDPGPWATWQARGPRAPSTPIPGCRWPRADLPVVTANAYLGGWGITAALQAGADMVVCPRVTDASLVTGPRPPGGTAGAVTTGDALGRGDRPPGTSSSAAPRRPAANYSFPAEITNRRYPGFPIAEVAADGSSVIAKHDGTGGVVSGGYRPPPSCSTRSATPPTSTPTSSRHFDTIRLAQQGPGTGSRLTGTRGQPSAGHPQGRAQHARRLPQQPPRWC